VCGLSEPLNNPIIPGNPEQSIAKSYVQLSIRDQVNFNAYLLRELEKIVRFIISNMGKIDQTAMENERSRYAGNSSFLQIFDGLTMKYFSAKKCKDLSINI